MSVRNFLFFYLNENNKIKNGRKMLIDLDLKMNLHIISRLFAIGFINKNCIEEKSAHFEVKSKSF